MTQSVAALLPQDRLPIGVRAIDVSVGVVWYALGVIAAYGAWNIVLLPGDRLVVVVFSLGVIAPFVLLGGALMALFAAVPFALGLVVFRRRRTRRRAAAMGVAAGAALFAVLLELTAESTSLLGSSSAAIG